MNYESMTDRELDIAVAEKVMGWYLASWCGEEHWHSNNNHGEKIVKENEWCPSTNISDAWQVVRKMERQENGLPWFRLHQDESLWWKAEFEHKVEGIAPEAPRAICIAALKAVEE